MERPKERRRKIKSHLCMPRFRGSARKSNRLSPAISLLDRFREAVFRLIMLSALSKATTAHDAGPPSVNSHRPPPPPPYHYPNDPHHSEAVADCIEFIKKSATTDDHNRDSTASTTSSISIASYVIT